MLRSFFVTLVELKAYQNYTDFSVFTYKNTLISVFKGLSLINYMIEVILKRPKLFLRKIEKKNFPYDLTLSFPIFNLNFCAKILEIRKNDKDLFCSSRPEESKNAIKKEIRELTPSLQVAFNSRSAFLAL